MDVNQAGKEITVKKVEKRSSMRFYFFLIRSNVYLSSIENRMKPMTPLSQKDNGFFYLFDFFFIYLVVSGYMYLITT